MPRERKKNRLPGYRYSRYGAYFVTICVKGRQPVLGRVVNGTMVLNQWGRIVDACWRDLPNHYGNIRLGDHVVMPDHVHGVVWIIGGGRGGTIGTVPAKIVNETICISSVGTGFKPVPTTIDNRVTTTNHRDTPGSATINNGDITTNHRDAPGSATINHGLPEIIRGFKTFSSRKINDINPGVPFRWQKSYHDRIIRNNDEQDRIQRYIRNNPARWRG